MCALHTCDMTPLYVELMMFRGLVELVILKGLFKFMFFEFVVFTELFAFDLARGVYHELNITNSTYVGVNITRDIERTLRVRDVT